MVVERHITVLTAQGKCIKVTMKKTVLLELDVSHNIIVVLMLANKETDIKPS